MARGRPEKETPSERELEVMGVLWELESGTVTELRDRLQEQLGHDFAYTTVLAMLQRLKDKGWVRTEDEGRAHRYFPAVVRDRVRMRELVRLTDLLFGGSSELLLTELISDRNLKPETLGRLRKLLDERLKARKP